MSIFYELAYLLRIAPWDTGVTPPELVAAVEGPNALPPGRALDLGCGTGTNSVYLAQHGWQVTGVDRIGRAIAAAKRRAGAAGVAPRLIRGDVTRLDELHVATGTTLVLDLGCFHSITPERRDAYAAGVTRVAAPGAVMLLFGFAPGARPGPRGVTADELRSRLPGWVLAEATRGTDRVESWWYRLVRVADGTATEVTRT